MKSLPALWATCLLILVLSSCNSGGKDIDSPFNQTPSNHSETPKDTNNATVSKEGVAEVYENTNRVIWQKPEMIINLMGKLEDKVVADIGAGRGYFTFPLAEKAKKVIAIDIDRRFINYLDSAKVYELPDQYQNKLETRLGLESDPRLKPAEVDVVLIVNTFMYIPNKLEYLKSLKNCLSENGQLIIVDFKKKRTPLGPPSDIRMPLFEVEELLYQTGYSKISTNDTALDYQYIIVADK
ncbi:MAG TPA: class I SAM-dependent methyltransferase [Saprospiraceae bacterium]|nr:class I SAM-dependent methyltransferase [Saprospiraceae bacterium]HMQ81847.1 class I SAM-dependent methyltransferase [Saprospiraceae bacterium]